MFFWPRFQENIVRTVFCREGCNIPLSDTEIYTATSTNITIKDLQFPMVQFNNDANVMVLIESSQTVKIVIEKFMFTSTFKFSSDSPVFQDEGYGNFTNSMTLTLAIQPNFTRDQGIFRMNIHSIVAQIFDLTCNNINISAGTIPLKLVAEQTENMRFFLLSRMNDMLKLFNPQIENFVNTELLNPFYSFTDPAVKNDNV